MRRRGAELHPTASGHDAHEALVQLTLIVEDRLADLIDRPYPLRIVGIVDKAAGEHFVAVAGRIEEINRLATRDAVAGRPDVERYVVARDDVGGLPRLGALDKGDVVRLVAAAEKSREAALKARPLCATKSTILSTPSLV
jgi:hypothetical protein